MPELAHLSYSSLSVYQACARSWKFKYLDGAPSPSSPALAFGSAWHNTIEAVIRSMALHQSADLPAIWREALHTAMALVPSERFELGDSVEGFYDDGLKLLMSAEVIRAIGELRPLMIDGEPVIEKRIELRVPGVPIPILGFIDLILDDGTPVDFKTSEKAWYQDRAFSEIQPLFYLAALMQEGFRPPAAFRFKHVVFPKTGKTRVQVFEHRHTPAELFWLFGAIRDCWTGINGGVFPPNPTSWKCSERYCSFWAQCRGRK